ncbi:MAG: NTP transferase domain-containing protein, partial [Planctomycetota bacterium]
VPRRDGGTGGLLSGYPIKYAVVDSELEPAGSAAVSTIIVVGHQKVGQRRNLENIIWASDEYLDSGPLEGIRVGLKAANPRCKFAFVTACDVPFIETGVIDLLLGEMMGRQAAIPVDGQRVFGMSAVYQTDSHTEIEPLIVQRRLRVSHLTACLESRLVDVEMIRKVDPELETLQNLNTPADYQVLMDRLGMEIAPELARSLGLSN